MSGFLQLSMKSYHDTQTDNALILQVLSLIAVSGYRYRVTKSPKSPHPASAARPAQPSDRTRAGLPAHSCGGRAVIAADGAGSTNP